MSPFPPALLDAVGEGQTALVKLLMEKGANPKIKNQEGLTPLDIAERENLPEIAAILRATWPKQAPKQEAK
jgi:ankyrin repeat protein